jgi:glc operon protein GlcG
MAGSPSFEHCKGFTLIRKGLIVYQTINISHAEALEMVSAVRVRLEQENKAGAIAVTDSHGELIAFLMMDRCHLPSATIAMNKAFTSARECQPSGEVGDSSRTNLFPMSNFGDPRYTGWAGGLPVTVDGQVAGAIGISGLDGKTETELAAYAVEVFARRTRDRS